MTSSGLSWAEEARDGARSGTTLSPPRASRRGFGWLILIAALGWAALVLPNYFTKAADLLRWHELDLARDMSSLAFLRSVAAFDMGSLAFWTYPEIGAAMTRAAVSVMGGVIVLVAADGAGRIVLRRFPWSVGAWPHRLPYRVSVGFAVLSLATLGLGFVGELSEAAAWVITMPLGLVSLAAGWRYVKSHPPSISDGCGLTRNPWSVIVALTLGLAFIVALAPETEYDAVWYHLGFPRLFLQENTLVSMSADPVSVYPMGWEMLYTLAMGIGGPGAAKLLHFAALPLVVLSMIGLARRVTPGHTPMLSGAIFVTIPTVFWEGTTAYVDLALTFHVVMLMLSVVRFADTRRISWLWLGAVNLGMALATKHLALLVVAILLPGLVGFLRLRDGRWRALPVLVLSTGVLLALPWYARAYAETGNPVFPELYSTFGAPVDWWSPQTESGLESFKSGFGRERNVFSMITLPWDVTVHGARYGGGLGPILLLLIPFACVGRTTRAFRWLAAFTALYIALWASPFSSFQLRFLLPITPLLSILAAKGAVEVHKALSSALGRRPSPAPLLLAGLLLLNLPPFISLHETDRFGWKGWLTHVVHDVPVEVVLGRETADEYLSRKLPSYQAWKYAGEHLDPSAKFLNYMNEDRLYSRHDWVAAHATMARPAVAGTTEAARIRAFDGLALTHILVSPDLLVRGESIWSPLLHSDSLRLGFEVVYEDRRAVVLERVPDFGRDGAGPIIAALPSQ